MDNGLIVPYSDVEERRTHDGAGASEWIEVASGGISRRRAQARSLGYIGPRKATFLLKHTNRTVNRHRWMG